jgi:hypothetical protein
MISLFKSSYVKLLEDERARLLKEIEGYKGQIYNLQLALGGKKFPVKPSEIPSATIEVSDQKRIEKVLQDGIAGTPWMKTKYKLEREIRERQALNPDPKAPKPITPIEAN